MDNSTKESVEAFAVAWLHKSIDNSPNKMVSLTEEELLSFVNEPGSTRLSFSYDTQTRSVQLSHIRLDDQQH